MALSQCTMAPSRRLQASRFSRTSACKLASPDIVHRVGTLPPADCDLVCDGDRAHPSPRRGMDSRRVDFVTSMLVPASQVCRRADKSPDAAEVSSKAASKTQAPRLLCAPPGPARACPRPLCRTAVHLGEVGNPDPRITQACYSRPHVMPHETQRFVVSDKTGIYSSA
jgi:hypothetical protein